MPKCLELASMLIPMHVIVIRTGAFRNVNVNAKLELTININWANYRGLWQWCITLGMGH